MESRTVLMGDWGRVVRDPIDLLRATFFIGAVVFLIAGEIKGVGNLLLGGTALLVARAVELPRLYDLGFTVAMIFTGWGEALGLYDLWKPYDNVVHFVVPMLCCQVAYIALARIEVLPDMREDFVPRHYLGIFTVTFALGVAIGGVWEIVEWGSDYVFGSNLSMGDDDTVGDLISDTLGATTAPPRPARARARRSAACGSATVSARGPPSFSARLTRVPGERERGFCERV